MHKPYVPWTSDDMRFRTHIVRKQVHDLQQRAENMEQDPDRHDRTEVQYLCVYCYYSWGGMAGAAMTESFCGLCETRLISGSTNTNCLCPACAKQHSLCRHCGSDMELRETRRTWEDSQTQQESAL